jgi:hypothetical protein
MKPLGKIISTVVLCAATWASQASFIASGEIKSILENNNKVGSTVDKWYFTVGSDSEVSFDVLSWEADEEGLATDDGFVESVDVNGDNIISFIDSFIYLFVDDGDLTADDEIDSNDDSDSTYGDGSLFFGDSFLVADLFAGDYILAIGAADPFTGLTVDEVISGQGDTIDYPATCIDDPFFFGCFLESSDSGSYQITFSGDVTENVKVSEPWMLALLTIGIFVLVSRKGVK